MTVFALALDDVMTEHILRFTYSIHDSEGQKYDLASLGSELMQKRVASRAIACMGPNFTRKPRT